MIRGTYDIKTVTTRFDDPGVVCAICEATKQPPKRMVQQAVREVLGYKDNFPPSKHRSKRIEKKLRKRLGKTPILGAVKTFQFAEDSKLAALLGHVIVEKEQRTGLGSKLMHDLLERKLNER